jgi:hypothetical protein
MQRILRPSPVRDRRLLARPGRPRVRNGPPPSSRTDLQTAAPTGRIVLLYTASATAADQARVAALAGAARRAPVAWPRCWPSSWPASAMAPAWPAWRATLTWTLPTWTADALLQLARRLAADRAVETAFLEPRAVPAALGFDAFTGSQPGPEPDRSRRSPVLHARFHGLAGLPPRRAAGHRRQGHGRPAGRARRHGPHHRRRGRLALGPRGPARTLRRPRPPHQRPRLAQPRHGRRGQMRGSDNGTG